MNNEGFPGHSSQIRMGNQHRPSTGRDCGVTYGCWLEVGRRAVEGGWVASLDSYTTQHVQQYLSVRAFSVNAKHTHKTQKQDMHKLDVRRCRHTHTQYQGKKQRD